MPNTNKHALDKRERKFIIGVASGKSLTQAAKDAGYAKSTAEKKASAIFHRPLVQSALTRALHDAGITYETIVRPIVEGLEATKSYIACNGKMRQTDVPDHHQRIESSKLAIKLLGGIPKVAQSIPSAQGVNLFLAVSEGKS